MAYAYEKATSTPFTTMSLKAENIPSTISPRHLCTPSRIVGEEKLVSVLRQLATDQSITNVLDIGCGSGEYRFLFPGCHYVGVDILNHRFRPKQSLFHRFIQASASHLPLKNESQDLVYSSYAFEYFPDPILTLHEIYRVLKPEGTAVLCLPAHWVILYDFPADVLRRLGLSIGHVSAQEGIHHYSGSLLSKIARETGFTDISIRSIYGWPLLLLKTLTSWYRLTVHLLSIVCRKTSRGILTFNAPLYLDRRVGSAQNLEELSAIHQQEMFNLTGWKRLYLLVIKYISRIDDWFGNRPVVEYILILHK